VALLTELPNNPGNSISSCIEIVAGIVTDRYNLNPNRTIWIEHYLPKEGNQFGVFPRDETFDLVTMQYDPNKELIRYEKQDNRGVETSFSRLYWKELAQEKAIEIILTGKLK